MKCSNCKKTLTDDTLSMVLIEHRANGLNCIQICHTQKCRDALAFYLLEVGSDKGIQKKIIALIKLR